VPASTAATATANTPALRCGGFARVGELVATIRRFALVELALPGPFTWANKADQILAKASNTSATGHWPLAALTIAGPLM
jgi:hypothetical protein